MSSNPTMLTSAGTERPAWCMARRAPMAMSSFPHNTAVTSGPKSVTGLLQNPTVVPNYNTRAPGRGAPASTKALRQPARRGLVSAQAGTER